MLFGRVWLLIIGLAVIAMHALVDITMNLGFPQHQWIFFLYAVNVPFWIVGEFRASRSVYAGILPEKCPATIRDLDCTAKPSCLRRPAMASQRKQFPFFEFEAKWQSRWLTDGAFRAPNPGDADFDPSEAEILRARHVSISERRRPSRRPCGGIHSHRHRCPLKRMRGFNVLHPMGWDAFGLPAEQFAIKTGQHPRITTERNIARFRAQLQSIGFSYDWAREFSTTDPDYFRWTQWIFLKLYGSWFNPQTQKAEPIETY